VIATHGSRAPILHEKLALQDLAARMADQPEQVLPRFVDLAMEMAGGVSAGLSLYEETPPLRVFRWQYLLHRENIGEVAVAALGPEMPAGHRLNFKSARNARFSGLDPVLFKNCSTSVSVIRPPEERLGSCLTKERPEAGSRISRQRSPFELL
jgi:hypothetical protein